MFFLIKCLTKFWSFIPSIHVLVLSQMPELVEVDFFFRTKITVGGMRKLKDIWKLLCQESKKHDRFLHGYKKSQFYKIEWKWKMICIWSSSSAFICSGPVNCRAVVRPELKNILAHQAGHLKDAYLLLKK